MQRDQLQPTSSSWGGDPVDDQHPELCGWGQRGPHHRDEDKLPSVRQKDSVPKDANVESAETLVRRSVIQFNSIQLIRP